MEIIKVLSSAVIPTMLLFTLITGFVKKIDVFSSFLSGARDALKTTVNIFPSVVILMMGIGIFRASGLLDFLSGCFSPVFDFFNIPREVLSIALLRPLSGSGGLAMLTDITKTCGPDSKAGVIASVICGSTETTFYTVAVYFGTVGITNTRHTIKCALIADLISVTVGILICSLLLF